MSRFGVDYAFSPHPSTAALKAARATFVCRYFAGHRGGSKELTAAEARALSAAGLDIVVVWETTAGRAKEGGRAGAPDARAALAQARQVGMPTHSPIYFAVDFDAEGPEVHRYFLAVNTVLGPERVGAYAGKRPISYLFDHKLIRYGWQTYAWSAGQWDSRAQIQQYSNGHNLGGSDVDYDRAMDAEFGQWRVGQPRPTGWRNLVITSPHTVGTDVRALQHAINLRNRDTHLPSVAEDGDFGHETLNAARRAGYYLGAGDVQLTGPIRPHLQVIIRAPWRRYPAEFIRGARRYKALQEHARGPEVALAWAHSQIGVTEHPPGSNRGPAVSGYQRNFGTDGVPWCGAFVGTALKRAGVPVTPRILYVPYIGEDGSHGANGMARRVSYEQRQWGDLICLFGFSHVEILDADRRHTIGGNTSAGDGGSQSNGGGVFRRVRDRSDISAIVRPRW